MKNIHIAPAGPPLGSVKRVVLRIRLVDDPSGLRWLKVAHIRANSQVQPRIMAYPVVEKKRNLRCNGSQLSKVTITGRRIH